MDCTKKFVNAGRDRCNRLAELEEAHRSGDRTSEWELRRLRQLVLADLSMALNIVELGHESLVRIADERNERPAHEQARGDSILMDMRANPKNVGYCSVCYFEQPNCQCHRLDKK